MDVPSIRGNQNTTKLIQYLKSSAKQYPALKYEGERELIEKNKYNREKLEKLLYLHNIRLVFSTVKHWKHKVNEFDEVVQDALNGLGEACRRFDPWKQAHDPKTGEPKFMPDGSPAFVKFTTFAMPWINKKILETVGKGKNGWGTITILERFRTNFKNRMEAEARKYFRDMEIPSGVEFRQNMTYKGEMLNA